MQTVGGLEVSAHKEKRDAGYSSRYRNSRAKGCMSANANFGESRVRDVTQITGGNKKAYLS